MFKKAIIGIFAGFVTGMFAAGGGMILVPAYIHLLGLSEKEARATSIFSILPLCLLSRNFLYTK